MEDNQPKGIAFYNIKGDETRYAKLEAQIQGYINSSDMGINASRGQDFKWRLAPEWVRAVRAFRRNESKMEILAARNGGEQPTTVQILYAIYGEQLRAAKERADENDAPFEENYLAEISERATTPTVSDPVDLSVDPEPNLHNTPPDSASGQVEHVPSENIDQPSQPTKPATKKK